MNSSICENKVLGILYLVFLNYSECIPNIYLQRSHAVPLVSNSLRLTLTSSVFFLLTRSVSQPPLNSSNTHTHTGIRSALANTPRNIDHDALVRRAFSCSTQRIERELLLGQTGSELHVTSSQEAQWPETQCKKSLYTRTPTHRGALGGLD